MTINIIFFMKMNVRRTVFFFYYFLFMPQLFMAFWDHFECEEFVCRAKLVSQEKWLFSDFPQCQTLQFVRTMETANVE